MVARSWMAPVSWFTHWHTTRQGPWMAKRRVNASVSIRPSLLKGMVTVSPVASAVRRIDARSPALTRTGPGRRDRAEVITVAAVSASDAVNVMVDWGSLRHSAI